MRSWVENSTDPTHGGGEWGYGKTLWAPQWNSGGEGKKSVVHTRVGEVKNGDLIIHLRTLGKGKNKKSYIDGYSFADGDGELTTDQPPNPGNWRVLSPWPSGEPARYYRAKVSNFTEFESNPIKKLPVDRFLVENYVELREHLSSQETKGLFYCPKNSDELKRSQGYLHTADDFLIDLIWKAVGSDFSHIDSLSASDVPIVSNPQISTSEKARWVATRIGQERISNSAKDNYGNVCCFPGCDINERSFLVGAHIVRWADNEALRGAITNVLCLCSLHDNGFESGYWWIDDQGRVAVNSSKLVSTRLRNFIGDYAGQFLKKPVNTAATPLQAYFDEHRGRF